MPGPPAAHADYLRNVSEQYQTAHAGLAVAVRRAFPRARAVFEQGMRAWRIPRPKGAPMPEHVGTFDPHTVFVALVERKTGITMHLWYPGDYLLLDRHEDELAAAGLKVMRGCLVHTRKTQPFPVAAVESVLHAIRARDAA